jgi:hypothetical protein
MRVKLAVYCHGVLAAYLWILAWFPLGNWNRQQDQTLLLQLLHGGRVQVDDVFALAFVTAPFVLFWLAYRYTSRSWAVAALGLDAWWTYMQVQSWWIPYILGAQQPWQIRYAQGPTTKVLPSFGTHVAPDGMHFLIHILLLASIFTGILALRQLWTARNRPKTPIARPFAPANGR